MALKNFGTTLNWETERGWINGAPTCGESLGSAREMGKMTYRKEGKQNKSTCAQCSFLRFASNIIYFSAPKICDSYLSIGYHFPFWFYFPDGNIIFQNKIAIFASVLIKLIRVCNFFLFATKKYMIKVCLK